MSKMNPLSKYTKVENLFVKLSTNNVIKYSNDVLENTLGECGVCARSSRDELLLNNPDALMNGQAVSQVIENCVPNVLDAGGLYVPDVEQLMVAIKIATKEDTYSIEVKCPNCGKHGAFERDLDWMNQTVTMLEEEPVMILDDVGGLVLNLVPLIWRDHSDYGVRMFQEQKKAQILEEAELSDEEKMVQFTQIVEVMTQINFDMIVSHINSIDLPDGEVSVTDKEFISDWLGQQPTFILRQIREKIKEFDSIGIGHTMDVECSECNHQWTIEDLIFDPSHFFGLA